MVALELFAEVRERDERVLVLELDLDRFLVRQETELLQRLLEVLNLPEYQRTDVLLIQMLLRLQVVLRLIRL